MLRILNFKVTVDSALEDLPKFVADFLKIKESDMLEFNIVKQSLDARARADGSIHFVYTIDVTVADENTILALNLPNVRQFEKVNYVFPTKRETPPMNPPIIIGTGPAGLAAGLLLAEAGYAPIVLERGESFEDRTFSVENYGRYGIKEESNIHFGEGGAATYSAGLFRSQDRNFKNPQFLKLVRDFKSAPSVKDFHFYQDKPILGSDVISDIVLSLRNKLLAHGGDIRCNTKVENLLVVKGRVTGVITHDQQVIYSDHIIIATGVSAKDSYEFLHAHGVDMTPLAFAVGLRIEHPKEALNRAQYREYAYHPNLEPATYNLNYRTKDDYTVYPFAVSPGGQIIPAMTEYGHLTIGGTTKSAKHTANTNAALVVQLKPEDLPTGDLFVGIAFQRELERKAYQMGGGNYKAPAQLVGDFLKKQPSVALGSVPSTYGPGITLCNLHDLLPTNIGNALIEAIRGFAKRIKGFDMHDAILTGIDSRPSSTIRITRNVETMESINMAGLYPAGEGAGYAAGIVSSYLDGIKVAEAVIASYEKQDK